MRKWPLWLLIFIALAESPAWAIGPSFDCVKVSSSGDQLPGAQLICSSELLSREDLKYTQAYYALRQQVGANGLLSLKHEAIKFESETLLDCGIPSPSAKRDLAISCMADHYESKRLSWTSRLKGPAAEEAARPLEHHIALQRLLQTAELLPSNFIVDGVYGSSTRDAIIRWQKKRGLMPSGFLSNDDAEALKEASLPSKALTPSHTEDPSADQIGGSVGLSEIGEETDRPLSLGTRENRTIPSQTKAGNIDWYKILNSDHKCHTGGSPGEFIRNLQLLNEEYRANDSKDSDANIVETSIYYNRAGSVMRITYYRTLKRYELAISALKADVDRYN
jgi:peptidoglycan hydrolase-like protein with peptidoglycan-binding domain